METPSMAIAFLVIAWAIKQWTARNQRKDIQENPKTQLDVGDAILLGTQQKFIIQRDVTTVIGLGTNPKTTRIQKVNI